MTRRRGWLTPAALLGETEQVHIKGAADPVPAHRLLGMATGRRRDRVEPTFVGRQWEMGALAGVLQRSVNGNGSIVGLVGPPGIGKSRVVRELTPQAKDAGAEVFASFCESHTTDLPLHTAADLLLDVAGAAGLDASAARTQCENGFRMPMKRTSSFWTTCWESAIPRTSPSRRSTPMPDAGGWPRLSMRRLASAVSRGLRHRGRALDRQRKRVHACRLPHGRPADAVARRGDLPAGIHWRLGACAALTDPGSRAARRLSDVALGPSSSAETGQWPSSPSCRQTCRGQSVLRRGDRPGSQRARRAGGRPRLLPVRRPPADVHVPRTLQAVIAARIDRLDPAAKRTLNAAAVIGSRFTPEMLESVGIDAALGDLVAAELIDQTAFSPHPEYAFRHPLIRAVAYESQLKSDRAQLHRRVASAIDQEDQNAALIAEHLEAAGDLSGPPTSGICGQAVVDRTVTSRAAQLSWERALEVADALPADEPNRVAMRIAPRTLLCANSCFAPFTPIFRHGSQELRQMCTAGGRQNVAGSGYGRADDGTRHSQPPVRGLAVGVGVHGTHRVYRRTYADGRVVLRSRRRKTPDSVRSEDILRWAQAVIDLPMQMPIAEHGKFIHRCPVGDGAGLARRGRFRMGYGTPRLAR